MKNLSEQDRRNAAHWLAGIVKRRARIVGALMPLSPWQLAAQLGLCAAYQRLRGIVPSETYDRWV